MRIQKIIWVIFLIFLSGSGFSQDNRNNTTIELESEGVCLFKKGDSKQITKKLACFNAKKRLLNWPGNILKEKTWLSHMNIKRMKSIAYYAMHEIEAMKASLENACSLGTDEACDDLKKIKRLQEYNLDF